MKKFIFSLLLFSSILFLLTSCSISQYSEVSTNVFDSQEIERIKIQNSNGNVDIKSWESEKIKIDITKVVKGIENLESEINKIKVSFKQTDDKTLNCTVTMPKSSNFLMSYSSDIIIRVPRKMFENIEVKLSNGKINVENVCANFELKTSNGKIDVYQSVGNFNLETSNGKIYLKGVQILRGENKVKTSNGDISGGLKLPAYGSLLLETSNGDINLELLDSPKVDLEVKTSNGEINIKNLNLVIEKQEKRYIKGKMNGGGFYLKISTSNGDISIQGIPAISV